MLAPAMPQGQPVARERQFHRRTHGLYFHSSPPKVFQMTNQLPAKDNDYRSRDAIKPSNIRIWLHHKQMSKLAKVLWAGQGMRLRTETSHHPKMKRFLECVPHVMGVIKDIHQAVIENDLDTLKEKTAPPAPRVILTSKDANGLTPLHKAAGLAHTQIVEYILSVWPSLSSVEDHTGKTPLHWAASAKNNARSFNLLVQAGADETALDDRHKPAEYYKNKPSDIDRSLLSVIPEAPRISQQGFPAYFDWGMFTLEEDSDEGSQTRMKPFLSQNNLLDADPASGTDNDHTSASVAKSKSVHNLTNGVLTDLSAGEPDKESANVKESPLNGTENGMNGDGKEADQEESGVNREHEATPTPTTAAEDETVVEPLEQHTLPEDGEANVPKGDESTNGDGGHDEHIVSAGTESVDQEDEVEQGGGEKLEEVITSTDATDGGGSADERQASAQSTSTVKSSKAGSRQPSAREVSSNGIHGPEELGEDNDSVHYVETNDSSREAVEEGEVSRDSLEHAPSAPKDDEIDQDSLGKDGDTEEAVLQSNNQEVEADTGSTRSLSAQSVKESAMKAPSRATSVKSNKSTGTGVESSDLAQVSKPSSASSERMPEKLPEDQPRSTESHEGNDFAQEGSSVKQTTAPSSASGERTGSNKGGHTETTNQTPKVTSGSSAGSAKDEEVGSRQASSGTSSDIASAKSTASVNNNRPASVISNKSINSRKSPGDRKDIGSEADDDSDSNNTDVQIVSYRTQDETDEVSSISAVANGITTEPLQQQELSEMLQDASEPMQTTELQEINRTPVESPSQALEIEGRVQGEADNGQLQSQNQRLVREELEQRLNAEKSVQDAIATADLEQLAVIVLEGKGKTLIGRTSEQSEIQAFLDNVPAYMGKIRRVHLAAREGNLRDLQSALDRRKFATAKDEVSPHGATPLHVATVFGHAGIVRYLAGRFPETLSATDDNGRTPLHYAATLKDNGHFYNLLTHLGANPKVEDSLNHSAEYYLGHVQSQGILSHRQLLRDYGAKEELAEEMLNDQVPDDLHSARRPLDDADTLTTLERCYKIIHEPIDDLVRAVGLPTNSVPGSASSLRILITSYLARFLKRSVFDKIKKRQTRLDHNLFDLIWPAMKKATKERRLDEDLNVGIVLPDYDVFVVFQEFLVPLIKDVHCMELTQPFMPHPGMQYFPRYAVDERPDRGQGDTSNGNILRENPDNVRLNLDTSGKYITGCVIECSRNLDAFEFPLNLGIAQLEQVERLITAKVLSMDFVRATGETELGIYYSMNEVLENPSEVRTVLAATGLLIPLLDHTDPYQAAESIAINGRYWPYGRGVYVSLEGNLVVWVNAQDHLRLLCCTDSKDPGAIGTAYSKVGRAMQYLEERIQFKHSYFLGHLISRPSFLGTGLKFTLTLALAHLCNERENLRHLCVARGLHLITDADSQPSVRMCNMRSLAQTEWQLFQDFSGAITNIVALEKEMSMSNSLHIAATLLRIFQFGDQQVEIPLFRTEEGRYLATSLGDPLIKGLTEVANKRPPDPIVYLANYLYNFANQKAKTGAKELGNDTNNNLIEGTVKQAAEKEVESSVKRAASPPTAMEPTVREEKPPSPEDSDENLGPSDDRVGVRWLAFGAKNNANIISTHGQDEHGQSMLHFACARSHGRNALIQLIEESGINITYRDELYRTARDVALQATQPDNAREIDRYVIGLAAKGDLETLNGMLLDGYDHIVDIVASDGIAILEVAKSRGHQDVVSFFETARNFEENRENLLAAIREKNLETVVKLTKGSDGAKLVRAKNYYGRNALHIAVLMENEDIVDYLASNFSAALKIGDNLQRTPLHYAMGVSSVEAISRILIKNGAKRVVKDLKGRQPTYYFMNKADILRLQEEEKE
ncbi:uncharacterized protein LOC118461199 isoform X2 [Anopheles albimanus]|uniref:uncharacterized protein LOC118461199 isoform X2 n=1 Tax=Anopheles albimanus TaxID=7167 RepID=UPI00163F27ED|nr:uncharacterized protein LOC118461199 isoform X2 [Anopheles albimanus]